MNKVCDGSGREAEGNGWAVCPVCGVRRNVTRAGRLRKHDLPAAMVQPVEPEAELQVAMPSVWEMRDSASRLKSQLRYTFEATKDPRFRRLWEHALTLETHLGHIHDQQAFDSVGVQLQSWRRGPNR